MINYFESDDISGDAAHFHNVKKYGAKDPKVFSFLTVRVGIIFNNSSIDDPFDKLFNLYKKASEGRVFKPKSHEGQDMVPKSKVNLGIISGQIVIRERMEPYTKQELFDYFTEIESAV